MSNKEYTALLKEQLEKYDDETRFLEFKSNYQDGDRLGKYISALSNGACLSNEEYGYLYFGVNDSTHKIKQTKFDYTHSKVGNQDLELFLRQYTTPKINFKIEEFLFEDCERIVVFVIPAAIGEPTTWKGKPYVRVNSQTTELTPYKDWIRQIYNSQTDWTKEIVDGATLKDLDEKAIEIAKDGYKERFPYFAKDVDSWSLDTFLDKAKLTINGKITRTSLLLLGKEESAHYLNHIAQIVWRLQTEEETAGDIYTIPFLLSTNKLLSRIRNYRIKIYPKNYLIPAEVWKYDSESILEAIYNCIAHQNYLSNARIVVTETTNELVFTNQGSFFDGSYEDYFEGTKTPEHYRNPFLTQAMVNIKMIDTQGYGIHKMFESQRKRFLPMPEYDNSEKEKVVLHMPGVVIDKDYSLMLMENSDLTLTQAYLLDQVQRKKPINDNAVQMLRKMHLVEGRKNALTVSSKIAKVTHQKAQYARNKGMDDEYYKDFLLKSIARNTSMSRKEIVELLWAKLPEVLNDKQKTSKIANLLTALKKQGKIKVGPKKQWYLMESSFKVKI